MIPKWKRFETLAADIQRDLSPEAVVTQNERVLGKNSGEVREIDIAIRQTIGQFQLFIAVDCKDYKRKVHVKDVEAFAGLLEDVGANKGAIISSKGFSGTAVRLAKRKGIDLYRLVSTDTFEWKAYVTIPTLVRNIRLKWRAVFQGRREDLEGAPANHDSILYNAEMIALGTVRENLLKMWGEGVIPEVPGTYAQLPLNPSARYVQADGAILPARTVVDAEVLCQWYFGHLTLTTFRGLANEIDGSLKSNQFITDWLPWVEIERSWQKLASPDNLAVEPSLTFFLKDAPIGDCNATRSIRLYVTSKLKS